MTVPLLDLRAQYLSIKDEIDAAIADVLASQKFILGPQVKALEEAIAKYCGCAHAVGVSSGTDALLVSLMAEGIGPGDEVITTAYSFFATAGCIARLGAKPVFCDIDPVTYNLDPSKLEELLSANQGPRTKDQGLSSKNCKAILPVHLYGQMADMDPIMDIAKRHNLVVIEDAAQAIGAEAPHAASLKFGVSGSSFPNPELGTKNQEPKTIRRRAGAFGEYGCFSFFPSKNLGAFGDGGMVVTNDAERAERLRVLRAHGSKPKYYHKLVGGNFRLDTLQAAIVLVKLRHLDAWTAARQANARRYDTLFRESGLVSSGFVQLPSIAVYARSSEFLVPSSSSEPGTKNQEPRTKNEPRHIYNQYVIRAKKRNELQVFLKERSVGTEVYYPLPLHLQECFAHLGHKPGDLPESEKAAAETLALPIYPELSDAQAECVVDSIRAFYKS
jgi:dTDP-4-amino-4,6-dideoxygalactose transaminase